MALMEYCIENLPDHPGDLVVPLPELARRVLDIYWQQVRPFEGHELRQSTQPRARILIAANDLRAAAGRFTWSVDVAAMRAPAAMSGLSTKSRYAWRSSHCTGFRSCPAPRRAIRSS